jgi:hypothetical protein
MCEHANAPEKFSTTGKIKVWVSQEKESKTKLGDMGKHARLGELNQ